METLWDILPSKQLYFKYWNSELDSCSSSLAPSMHTRVVLTAERWLQAGVPPIYSVTIKRQALSIINVPEQTHWREASPSRETTTLGLTFLGKKQYPFTLWTSAACWKLNPFQHCRGVPDDCRSYRTRIQHQKLHRADSDAILPSCYAGSVH